MYLLKKLGLLSVFLGHVLTASSPSDIMPHKNHTPLALEVDKQESEKKDIISAQCKNDVVTCAIGCGACMVGGAVITGIVIGALANQTAVTNNTDTAKKVFREYSSTSRQREESIAPGDTKYYPHGSFKTMCVEDGGCWSNKELEGEHGCLGRHLELNPNNSSLGYSTDLHICGKSKDNRRLSYKPVSGFGRISDFMNEDQQSKYSVYQNSVNSKK